MSRPLALFFAPPDADPPTVRRAGLRSFLAGTALCAATFVALTHDATWFHGRIQASGWRGLTVLGAVFAYGFAVQGGFRMLTGVARGGEDPEPPTALARTARVVYLLLAAVGTLAVMFGGMMAITPHAPDAPAVAVPTGIDVPLPRADQREVEYRIGDATVSITRVTRDAAVAIDGTSAP